MDLFILMFAINCMFFIPVYKFIKKMFGGIRAYVEIAVLTHDEFNEIPVGVVNVIVAMFLFLLSPLIFMRINRFL